MMPHRFPIVMSNRFRLSRPFPPVPEVKVVPQWPGSSNPQVRKNRQVSGYMQIASTIADIKSRV